jgi:hypothetical protein
MKTYLRVRCPVHEVELSTPETPVEEDVRCPSGGMSCEDEWLYSITEVTDV